MSQHDYNIANGGGAAVRADINNALLAILSQNSGATAPTTTKPFMPWYDTANGIIKIRNSADTAWLDYMNSSGQLIAPTATGLITALGGQIKFPASQNASADANTLDDYEEGTWTPAISGLTFSTARGTYTKVGNLCYCTIELGGSNTSKTSTDIAITGFPFTSNATYDFAAVSVPFTEVSNISLSSIAGAACILMYGRIPISVTYMQLLQTNGKAHDAFTAGGGLSTGATLRTSFCYRTA